MFLCMQSSNTDYGVSWKKAYLEYDIIMILISEKWNESVYNDLMSGKISLEEAAVKTAVKSEELGERIYYLDQLYYEENHKHNRALLEKAATCGDKDAFDILQSL